MTNKSYFYYHFLAYERTSGRQILILMKLCSLHKEMNLENISCGYKVIQHFIKIRAKNLIPPLVS